MNDSLEQLFTYHSPSAEAIEKMAIIRDLGYRLARQVYETVPTGSDRAAAIRKIREAVMTANAGIVLNGVNF